MINTSGLLASRAAILSVKPGKSSFVGICFEALTACNNFPRRIGHGGAGLGFAIHFFSQRQVRLSVGRWSADLRFLHSSPDCRSSAAFAQLAPANFIG
jgi:hypothetical protein